MANVTQLVLDELKRHTQQNAQASLWLRDIKGALQHLAAPSAPASAAPAGTLPTPAAAAAPGQGGGGLGGILGTLGGAFSAVTGAVGAVAGAMEAAVNGVMKFTEALAPSVVLQFQFTMRDLTATVGVALQPLAEVVVSLTRSFGQMLLPVMEQLKPVMAELAGVIEQVATAQFGILSAAFQALVPIVKVVTEVLAGVWPFLQAVGNVFSSLAVAVLKVVGTLLVANPLTQAFLGVLQVLTPVLNGVAAAFIGLGDVLGAVVESFMGALGLDIKGVFKGAADAVAKFTAQALFAAAQLIKMLSPALGAKFLDSVINTLSGGQKKDNTGLAAALNPNIGNIGGIASEQMKAALIAGGRTDGKKEKTPQEIMVEELKALREGQVDVLGRYMKELKEYFDKKFKEGIVMLTKEAFNAGASAAADAVKNNPGVSLGLLGPLGYLAGRAFGSKK